MKLRKHLFVVLLIIMGVISAVYVFRESLAQSLRKAFPNDPEYKGLVEPSLTEKTYRIIGSYENTATAKDVDIQAELTLNSALRSEKMFGYEEALIYNDLYLKNYTGPKQALIGFGTDKEAGSLDVEIENGKYSRLNAVFLSEDVVRKWQLGTASRMFPRDNTYLGTMKVVLGAGLEGERYNLEEEGRNKIILRIESRTFEAEIIGFTDLGQSIQIGDQQICLDYYVICPFLDLTGLYGEGLDRSYATRKEPIYVADSWLSTRGMDVSRIKDTAATVAEFSSTKEYVPLRTLWISETDIDAMNKIPDWLKSLRSQHKNIKNENECAAYAGYVYSTAEMSFLGVKADIETLYDGSKSLLFRGMIPEGETLTIGGTTYELDDYIVMISPADPNATADDDDDDDDDGDDDGKDSDKPEGKTFDTNDRLKLFRILVLKNSCYINTRNSADEVQRRLTQIQDAIWANYEKDNKGIERTSNYYVKEADRPGSVVYRESLKQVPEKLEKVDSIGYYVCIFLLLLYLIYKFFKGSDFYTTIVMTGDTKLEVVLVFLAEAALLYGFACGVGFVFSWIVCKLLGFGTVAFTPVLTKNLRIIGIPFAIISLWILIKDYGKIFRRR